MNKSKKQIGIGALLSYFSIALNLLAGLIYTPWMIRQIGQSQYGLYTLSLSLISLFMVDFGLGSAVARYVSNCHAKGEEEQVNQFLGIIYKLYIIIDVVIFVVLIVVFLFIDLIYSNLTPSEIQQFKIVYSISSVYSLIQFPCLAFNGILTAYEKFIPLKLADVIYRLLFISLTIFVLLHGWGLFALVTMNSVSGLIVSLYKFVVIKKTTPVKADFSFHDKNLYKEIFSFSIWITIASLAQRLIFNITPTILGILVDTSSIAIFGIITTIEGYMYTITTAINGMFMPRISRMYIKDDNADLMPLMLQVGQFQFFVNGLLIVGFIVIGSQFIQLWMGDAYTQAYQGIILVIVPGIFYNSLEIANTAVIVKNKVRITAFVNVLVGLLNIILEFKLAAYYGLIGSCIAIFISYTLRAILLNIIYHKILDLDMILFAKKCYIKMSWPILLSVATGMIINKIPLSGWLGLGIKGAMISFVYIFLVWLIALTKKEKLNLMATIHK